MNKKLLLLAGVLLAAFTPQAFAQYPEWRHSGSLYILTSPEGADLPATASVEGFPLLVRLNKGNFDFSQARTNGEDIRFSAEGKPLAYQVEEWDAAQGTAGIWVRIPTITGNSRQEIKLHWGKADAAGESNGSAVFGADNGYASVLHMDKALKDEVGTVTPKDAGSTAAAGIIGESRHFVPGKGVNCGDNITSYPYSDSPFTSEAWVRAEAAGSAIFGWGRYATRYNGNTGDGNEVVINIGSPPSLSWSSDGPGGASAGTVPAMRQWNHAAATYENGTSRIYVNGKLEGSNYHKAAMSIVKDICMNIGGLRGSYQFTGDIDEVRVSRVARSADWIKLEYENQKARQTLVGTLVQPGSAFSVSPTEIKVSEGKSATVTAQAGGAQKVYWILKRDGADAIVAVDQYSYTLDAGRVVSDTAFVLQFKAVYPNEVKIMNIPVTIKEEIPEPVFYLVAPAAWNGRDTIEVVPEISNLKAMQTKGAGELKYHWTVSGGAVIKEIAPDKLALKRSQCSGRITVRLALNNGGADFAATTSILVTEPKRDPWVQRTAGKDEKPEDNQFFARDDKNEGTLYYNGTLDQAADAVFLKVYADGKVFKTESRQLAADKAYAFTVKLKPGLIKYKVEFGTKTGGAETVVRTVTNLICGDAYIIDGQSNAEATGPNNGPTEDPVTPINDWIRSYGNQYEGTTHGGWGNAVRTHIWGKPDYGCHQIGAWGMVLATNLVEKYQIPICIINGAYGGTPIWHHQPNPADHYDTSGAFYGNPYKIYGSLLTRVTGAKLTHGIRGVLWHQGENDQGSGAPTGDYNWKSYQEYFVNMSAAWKQDYPNIQHYYVYQIWPSGCNMGGTPAGDMLLEVQRTLPSLYSNMRIMSTLGIVSGSSGRGLAHFDLEGYAQLAQLMSPLVEQDNYGLKPSGDVTVPNLKRAWFTTAARNEIALDFGQPMAWKDECKAWIYLDSVAAPIGAGKVAGNVITLKLTAPSSAGTISYLAGRDWDGRPDKLLYGANGIAALAFCSVPLAPSAAAEAARLSFEPAVESLKQYETPEWFEDAKLGIYMHWGPQSIPGVATTWYARWIYEQGSEGYKYHVATYGHPSKFGYKDICKLFTAPKFDQAQADRLVKLYKQIGARYVVPVAVHHDNFDMWDSKYQPRWNSVATSGKDVVGMWKKAAVKHGLHLGVASHVARTYRWLQPSHGADHSGPLAGLPYDGQNPEFADLYGVKWKDNGSFPDFWYEQRSDVGPPEFEKQFENRMKDLMDKYHPDLYYTDGGIPFKQAGLNVLAHFYNENQKWNDGKLQAVATIKLDWTPNVAINNYEFGYPETVQHYHWQSDKTMGADWYWIRNATARYMSAQQALHMLIDTVSKNGNLLLNVPLTPEGELEPETVAMLTQMGRCLDIIGEAVFSTRCWAVADDGPGSSIRFTRNKENTVLYVTNLGWSNDELRIKTLNSSRIALKTLVSVSLLGAPGNLTYSQNAEGLTIKVPPKAPYDSPAYAFKLTFSGQIPPLNSAPTQTAGKPAVAQEEAPPMTLQAVLTIDTDTPSKNYSPMIFGGFLEHFHTQVYGGVFDPGSPLADKKGFRGDVVAALKELRIPIVRWPGGCYASGYHWEAGVGKKRGPTDDMAWGVIEPNTFGTDEFVELCRLLGWQPYICNNAGNGTVGEMRSWVEYCNGSKGKYAQMRKDSGYNEPRNVNIWSIGNENWGQHEIGYKPIEQWAPLVLEAAKEMKAADPHIQLTAAALPTREWTLPLLKKAGQYLDYISIHSYWLPLWQKNDMPDYLTCIMESESPEQLIADYIGVLEESGYRGRIKIAFDEWNLRGWHHPGFPRKEVQDYSNPEVIKLIAARDKNLIASQYTMADALFSASFLNACLRHAEDVGMANIAPIVNTRGPLFVHPKGIVKRTHFHTMAMYANELEDRVGKLDIQADKLTHGSKSVPVIDAIATVSASGKNWAIALVSRHPEKAAACTVKMKDLLLEGNYEAMVLAGDSPDSYNDIENPNRVVPEKTKLTFAKGVVNLAPHSLTIVKVPLK